MTKETKVGLLVGLTFIILFAIILSEKGSKTTAPSNLTMVDAGPVESEIEIPAARQPLANDGAFPVDPPLTSIRPRHSRTSGPIMLEEEEPLGRPIPGVGEVPELPDAVVQGLNMVPMSETPVDMTRENDYGPQVGDDTVSLEEAVARAQRQPPEPNSSLFIQPDPEEDLSESSQASASHELEPPPPAAELRPKIIATHEVESGESISKIASKYFGRSTPARINAIFDVNRDVLKSVDAVRAGDVLKIPGLNSEGTVAFVPVSDFAPSKVVAKTARRVDDRTPRLPYDRAKDRPTDRRLASRTSTQSREFVWYQVKERDTLSGISQRELGSTRHYLKIYKINKDILPDKNTLKPGIKIRLPIIDNESTSASTTAPRSSITNPSSVVSFSRETGN